MQAQRRKPRGEQGERAPVQLEAVFNTTCTKVLSITLSMLLEHIDVTDVLFCFVLFCLFFYRRFCFPSQLVGRDPKNEPIEKRQQYENTKKHLLIHIKIH